MDNLELYPVLPKDVLSIKDDIIPILELFHKHNEGSLPMAVIFESVLKGERILWAGKDEGIIGMILVTEFQDDSLFVTVWATKSGWDFSTWYPLTMSKLEQFARYFYCKELRAITRKGLARKIKQDWNHEHCIITKKL